MINNAIRTVAETEEVGLEITTELQRNREKINSAHTKVCLQTILKKILKFISFIVYFLFSNFRLLIFDSQFLISYFLLFTFLSF